MSHPDKQLIRKRFAAQLHSYDQHAIVQKQAATHLAELLAATNFPTPAQALEIGAGSGFLSQRLLSIYPLAHWYFNDINEDCQFFINQHVSEQRVSYLIGDAERLAFPQGLGLIASASAIQWFENARAFWQKAHAALRPKGLIAVASYGPENFKEIKAITGEGLHYHSLGELETLAQEQGFQNLHKEEYTQRLIFSSPLEVLRHIKLTGVNAIRAAKPLVWTKHTLENFCAEYNRRFAEANGAVPLTSHVTIYIGSADK